MFLLLLACSPVPVTVSGSEDSASCTKPEVPAGTYGGAHLQLVVAADGSAELFGDCSRATTDAVPVNEGQVHWDLSWQSGWGLPVQDTSSIVYQDVTLDGTFCAGTLDGTLTFPDGSTENVHVVKDAQAEIYGCA